MVKKSRSKSIFAHPVGQKGADKHHYGRDCIVADVQWLGCPRVALKTDNENPITNLSNEALKALRVNAETADTQQIFEERPPPYDHQANGKMKVFFLILIKFCLGGSAAGSK